MRWNDVASRPMSRRVVIKTVSVGVGSGILGGLLAACSGSPPASQPTAASITTRPPGAQPTVAPSQPTTAPTPNPTTAPAVTAPTTATLTGNFTTLGWGDIPYNQSMLDGYAKAFPDKVGSIKFTAEGAKSEQEVLTKVLTAYAAKSGVPDIFQQNAPTVPQLIDQGILAPLDDLINPHKDVFSPGLLDALSAKGHPYEPVSQLRAEGPRSGGGAVADELSGPSD